MKVSELWLRELINLPLSITEIGEQLTHAGIEVDALEKIDDKDGLQQSILTLKVPPNRGDCLSMQGIARELALLNNIPFHAETVKTIHPTIADSLVVKNKAPALCPYYAGRMIKNINTAAKTPDWLTKRLEWAGIRSISLIVDISNYVMLELGQPLHAFDLDNLNTEIIIRTLEQEEKFILLEGQEIKLEKGTLVVADKEKPLALAGIMGGKESSVSETTKNIFIESAYFEPINLRLFAKKYSLHTESSHRFERGVDFQLQKKALERATELLLMLAGGQAGPIVESLDKEHLPKNSVILFRPQKVQEILGTHLTTENILDILKRANMTIKIEDEKNWSVRVPSFRQDLILDVDLIEEVARVFGFLRLNSLPLICTTVFSSMPEKKISNHRFKQILADRGYSEAMTYSFIDPKIADLFVPGIQSLSLANPISIEMAAMRETLWPGLVKAIEYNQRRQHMRLRLFEMGLCFKTVEGKLTQRVKLAGACSGTIYREQWAIASRMQDYYDIKQDVESLLRLSNEIEQFYFEATTHPSLHPGQAARILKGDILIGHVGAIHPRIIKELDMEGPVFAFELDLEAISNRKIPQFRDLSKYPAIRRDIAIIVDETVFASTMKSAIVKGAGSLLQEVFVFDVYQGKGIETGKKSMAFALILQHKDRTLVENEVNEVVKNVVAMLANQFQAILREH